MTGAFEMTRTTTGVLDAGAIIHAAHLFSLFKTQGAQTIDMADATVTLQIGSSGANTQILSSVLLVDPNSGGASEILLLPAESGCPGLMLVIKNTGGESIVVKDDSNSTTVVTIPSGNSALVINTSSTTWAGGVLDDDITSDGSLALTGTFSVDGLATFAAGLKFTGIATAAAAGTGSDNTDATAITSYITYVTASDDTKGVVLPTAVAGLEYIIYNTVAGKTLRVWAASGDDINDGTAASYVKIGPKQAARFVAIDTTTWAAVGVMPQAAQFGTAGTGATAVEYSADGIHHTTVLTLSSFAVGTAADNAAKAIGGLLYTLPAGACIVESAQFIDVALTLDADVQSDTPELGIGTTQATGATATLGDVAATAEDIGPQSTAWAAVDGTTKDYTTLPAGSAPQIIETADAHTLYLNAAATWADSGSGTLALTAGGTIIINWRKVS